MLITEQNIMLKQKEIVGLVPVKGSSDRIPRKNLRKFSNTSLYELKLKLDR